MSLDMALYAAWVMWMPSQLTYADGSAHTAAPFTPHARLSS